MRAKLEAALLHLLLAGAVLFAVYPLLWVVSIALSGGGMGAQASALPVPRQASLANFAEVLGTSSADKAWLFWRQLGNSLVVSLSTALVAVAIATPAANGPHCASCSPT